MGAHKCQYGFTHKTCRCPKTHVIICDNPEHRPKQQIDTAECIVLKMRREGRLPGKHAKHEPHRWWYTTYGGGHQLNDDWQPTDSVKGWDAYEGWVTNYQCPGN